MSNPEVIATYLRTLLDKVSKIESRLDDVEQDVRADQKPAGEFAAGNPMLNIKHVDPVQVVGTNTPVNLISFRGVRLTPDKANLWTIDTTLQSKVLDVGVPSNATMPNSGDVVTVQHIGNFDSFGVLTPRYMLVSGSGGVEQVRLKGVGQDSLVVATLSNSSEGSQFLVSKPFRLRRTPFDGKIYGGISYSYVSNTERTAASTVGSETQVVVPRYLPNTDILYVQSATTDVTGGAANWIDLNVDGRAWAEEI